MAREVSQSGGDMRDPRNWPDWVLGFNRGLHADPAAQAVIREQWLDWKQRRAEWAADVPGFSVAAAQAERRRRAGRR